MSTEQKFNCVFCNQSFVNKELLQVHFRQHGDPNQHYFLNNSKKRLSTDGQISTDNDKEMVSCDVCPEVFPTISKAISHKHKAHPEYDEKHFCPWCGKLFTLKHLYEKHIITHETYTDIVKEKFPCDSCSKEFYLVSAMLYHNKFFHRQDVDLPAIGYSKKQKMINKELVQLYYCAFCGEEYINKVNLHKHMYDDHGDEDQSPDEVLRCPLCEAIFYHLDAYQIHISYHTTEDVFPSNDTDKDKITEISLETVPPITEVVQSYEQSMENEYGEDANCMGAEQFLSLVMDNESNNDNGSSASTSEKHKQKKHKKHKKSKKPAITLDEFLTMNQDVFGEGIDFQGIEEVPTQVVAKQFKKVKKNAPAVSTKTGSKVMSAAHLQKLKQQGIVVKMKSTNKVPIFPGTKPRVVNNITIGKPIKVSSKATNAIVNQTKPTQVDSSNIYNETVSKLLSAKNSQLKIVRKSTNDNTSENNMSTNKILEQPFDPEINIDVKLREDCQDVEESVGDKNEGSKFLKSNDTNIVRSVTEEATSLIEDNPFLNKPELTVKSRTKANETQVQCRTSECPSKQERCPVKIITKDHEDLNVDKEGITIPSSNKETNVSKESPNDSRDKLLSNLQLTVKPIKREKTDKDENINQVSPSLKCRTYEEISEHVEIDSRDKLLSNFQLTVKPIKKEKVGIDENINQLSPSTKCRTYEEISEHVETDSRDKLLRNLQVTVKPIKKEKVGIDEDINQISSSSKCRTYEEISEHVEIDSKDKLLSNLQLTVKPIKREKINKDEDLNQLSPLTKCRTNEEISEHLDIDSRDKLLSNFQLTVKTIKSDKLEKPDNKNKPIPSSKCTAYEEVSKNDREEISLFKQNNKNITNLELTNKSLPISKEAQLRTIKSLAEEEESSVKISTENCEEHFVEGNEIINIGKQLRKESPSGARNKLLSKLQLTVKSMKIEKRDDGTNINQCSSSTKHTNEIIGLVDVDSRDKVLSNLQLTVKSIKTENDKNIKQFSNSSKFIAFDDEPIDIPDSGSDNETNETSDLENKLYAKKIEMPPVADYSINKVLRNSGLTIKSPKSFVQPLKVSNLELVNDSLEKLIDDDNLFDVKDIKTSNVLQINSVTKSTNKLLSNSQLPITSRNAKQMTGNGTVVKAISESSVKSIKNIQNLSSEVNSDFEDDEDNLSSIEHDDDVFGITPNSTSSYNIKKLIKPFINEPCTNSTDKLLKNSELTIRSSSITPVAPKRQNITVKCINHNDKSSIEKNVQVETITDDSGDDDFENELMIPVQKKINVPIRYNQPMSFNHSNLNTHSRETMNSVNFLKNINGMTVKHSNQPIGQNELSAEHVSSEEDINEEDFDDDCGYDEDNLVVSHQAKRPEINFNRHNLSKAKKMDMGQADFVASTNVVKINKQNFIVNKLINTNQGLSIKAVKNDITTKLNQITQLKQPTVQPAPQVKPHMKRDSTNAFVNNNKDLAIIPCKQMKTAQQTMNEKSLQQVRNVNKEITNKQSSELESVNDDMSADNDTETVSQEVTVKTFQTKTVIQEVTTTVTKTIKTINQTINEEVKNQATTSSRSTASNVKTPVVVQEFKRPQPVKSVPQGIAVRQALNSNQIRAQGQFIKPNVKKFTRPTNPLAMVPNKQTNIIQPRLPNQGIPVIRKASPQPFANRKPSIGNPVQVSPIVVKQPNRIIRMPVSPSETPGPFSCFKKPKESLIPVSDVSDLSTSQNISEGNVNTASRNVFTNTTKVMKSNVMTTSSRTKSEFSASTSTCTNVTQHTRSNNASGLKVVKNTLMRPIRREVEQPPSSAPRNSTLIEKLQQQGLLVKKPRLDISFSDESDSNDECEDSDQRCLTVSNER